MFFTIFASTHIVFISNLTSVFINTYSIPHIFHNLLWDFFPYLAPRFNLSLCSCSSTFLLADNSDSWEKTGSGNVDLLLAHPSQSQRDPMGECICVWDCR